MPAQRLEQRAGGNTAKLDRLFARYTGRGFSIRAEGYQLRLDATTAQERKTLAACASVYSAFASAKSLW